MIGKIGIGKQFLIFNENNGLYNNVRFNHLTKNAKIEVLIEENEILHSRISSLKDYICRLEKEIVSQNEKLPESKEIEILYDEGKK